MTEPKPTLPPRPGLASFAQGVGSGFYDRIVKPYASLVGEAFHQTGRLANPAFRKSVFGGDLTPEEAEQVLASKPTKYLEPSQLDSRAKIAGTGLAATSKAMLAASGLANPASLVVPAVVSGGLGYGAASLAGADNPAYEAGRAVGYSPVYAGINKVTSMPIKSLGFPGFQQTIAKTLFPKSASTLGRVLTKGAVAGTSNVAEDIAFTPMTEGRMPTKRELAVDFGTGMAVGAGGEAISKFKNLMNEDVPYRDKSGYYRSQQKGVFVAEPKPKTSPKARFVPTGRPNQYRKPGMVFPEPNVIEYPEVPTRTMGEDFDIKKISFKDTKLPQPKGVGVRK
jgi:hypothetical protein